MLPEYNKPGKTQPMKLKKIKTKIIIGEKAKT